MKHRSAWEDGSWRGLSRLDHDVTADVCVVGLGGSGLTAVEALASAGVDVVGIDAGSVAHGAAGSNGGFLLAGLDESYHDVVTKLGSATAKRLYAMTLGEIDRLETAHPTHVRRTGMLRIAASDNELDDCRLQRNAMLIDGFAVETYEGIEGSGLMFPNDASFNPLIVCRSTATSLLTLPNVRLFEHTPAVRISEGRCEFKGGRVACSRVIVAVDGRLDTVFPELACRVHTVRLQMLATLPVPRVVASRPTYYRWLKDYWQQLPDGRIFLGGQRDLFMDAERTHDEGTSIELQDGLEAFLRGHLGVTEPIERRWAASVGVSSNMFPVVAEPRPGVWAVGAYNTCGNVMGRLCGRAVADRVLGRDNELIDILGET
jgi:gamma-glutamylputrescine oxidase